MAKTLKEKLAAQIPKLREERKSLLEAHGSKKLGDVTMAMAFGGMRGIKGMVCDTSVVEPDKGLIIRGRPILKLTKRLPEEIFWLLIMGKMPSKDELALLQKDLKASGEVPAYIWKVLKAMPKSSHPMAMLNTAILTMENESAFRKAYAEGIAKTDYWIYTLEDSMRVMGTIHTIAAGIYRIKYHGGKLISPSRKLDWAADYTKMLGLAPKGGDTADMMRLYLTLHCDHEGGNVSANTCHTVGSALSDPFYAVSAGLNGLAGPLHGLANQECLKFVLEMMEEIGGTPTKKQIKDYAWARLNAGQVIPGYGHAVLRVTDPRFTAFLNFGKKYLADSPVHKTVAAIYQVVPGVLKEHGKAANPWPNVDAGSGSVLYNFGIREFEYYTVLFSVSRAMGMLAQLVLNRALGSPITRPKSVSTVWMKDFASK